MTTATIRLLAAMLVVALPAATALSEPQGAASTGTLVYIGTYTGPKSTSKGIYAFRFDDHTGRLTPIGLVAETPSPSFLALHPSGRFLYAVNEVGNVGEEKGGSVSAFAIDVATGHLTLLNTQPSRGADPCYLTVDAAGAGVLVANYTGGNLAVLPIEADGRLGPPVQVVQHTGRSVNHDRQAAPHAHSIDLDAANQFAVAADLGADKLFVYRYSAVHLTPNLVPAVATEPGSGPRHFAFHPNGKVAFAINEMASTITSYGWDGRRGTLTLSETVSTVPSGSHQPNTTAEIRVHPSGRFVYGSNRGHDSIAVFATSPTGHLTLVERELTRGKEPRNFTIAPGGRWLVAANQGSNTLAVFQIDEKTGALAPVGPLVPVGVPVCVVFVP
jgi:6-phosphogluconolactonase